MKFLALACIALINYQVVSAQTFFGSQPLAHTYSIVARDPQTGEMGVAVQSHWFSVGTIVSWGKAGVGVVATQSLVNASLGPRGLALLENGLTPQQALDGMLAHDEGAAYRQVAILDAEGNLAVHTGEKCIPEAGHVTGENYAIQANLMANDQVWIAMEEAFLNTKGPLAERMVAALEAGQQGWSTGRWGYTRKTIRSTARRTWHFHRQSLEGPPDRSSDCRSSFSCQRTQTFIETTSSIQSHEQR